MLGREVTDDAVCRITQEALACSHRFEDAVLALDAEIDVESASLSDHSHHRFGAVDVEIIHDQVPRGRGTLLRDQRFKPLGEVLLGACWTKVVGDLAGDHIERGDQRQRAMTDVLELAPLHQATTNRQSCCRTLERLHASHLIDAVSFDAHSCALRRQPIGLAHIPAFLVELLIARGVDPTTSAMRLEIRLAQEAPNGVR